MREEQIGGQRLILGDCLEVLPGLAAGSVDLVATDPPYGIAFMGKDWDRGLPDPRVWNECLRVLKPGGSAVVMSGSRLDCLWRMCRDLEAAGFELSQTALYWCYRSGFPKGGDLSKLADARAGTEREVVGTNEDYLRRKPNGMKTDGAHSYGWSQSQYETNPDITAPATPQAIALDGWFTKGKVKPAVEVIIWARKPISERTELDNMTRWGVGGVNCGACMVPFEPTGPPPKWGYQSATPPGCSGTMGAGWQEDGTSTCDPRGRFPANLLVTEDALGGGSRYFDVDAWAAAHGYTEDGWAEAAAAGLLQVCKPAASEKSAGLGDYVTLKKDLPDDVRAMVLQRLADAGLGTAGGTGE